MGQTVDVQRVQKEALNNIKEAKEFDSLRYSTPKHDYEAHEKRKAWKTAITVAQGTCRDSALHMAKCEECGKTNHLKSV